MKYLATFLCIAVIASGCSSTSPTAPQRSSASLVVSPAPTVYPQISVGQTVKGTLATNGAADAFELTAPTSGTLTVTVSWDGKDGIIELRLGNKQFGYELGNPLTGTVSVVAGEKYLIRIADAAPWDYHGLHLPYTFNSSIR